MAPARNVTSLIARRFLRRALGLDRPFLDIGSALAHLGYVQIDPINVCGRMHDLILRNRVDSYQVGGLMVYLHGGDAIHLPDRRTAFEHHLPDSSILAAFPLDAWPHLIAAMRLRSRRDSAWSGKLTPSEREMEAPILAEIAARGPLSSLHLGDKRGSAPGVWGAATLAKSTMQKLFFHGRLLIARRDGNRRLYDLPERVLPAEVLAAKEPSTTETARWLAMGKLRQRRLTSLKRTELDLIADQVLPITLSDADAPKLYCLLEDVEILEFCLSSKPLITPPLLLAPLDPIIYDRRVTAALWGFDYTWEVYTPPHKRIRGYYALPVLSGHEMVGHVEPKADNSAGKLNVVSRSVRRGHSVSQAVKDLATFLGLR